MSGAPVLSAKLVNLMERWQRIVSTSSELDRVGVSPKPGNRRSLIAMLARQPKGQLERLREYCLHQQDRLAEGPQRLFWANRILVVEEAITEQGQIQKREKRKRKAIRRQRAETLEREFHAEKARTLDPQLGMKLSTDHDRNYLSGFVQGGAPGSKR